MHQESLTLPNNIGISTHDKMLTWILMHVNLLYFENAKILLQPFRFKMSFE